MLCLFISMCSMSTSFIICIRQPNTVCAGIVGFFASPELPFFTSFGESVVGVRVVVDAMFAVGSGSRLCRWRPFYIFHSLTRSRGPQYPPPSLTNCSIIVGEE